MSTLASPLRERLEEKSLLRSTTKSATAPVQETASGLSTLKAVLGQSNSGAAFHSVVMAAIKIVEHAACHEHCVAKAALSLGQQEKLSDMIEVIDETALLLREQLSMQGTGLMHLCGEKPSTNVDTEPWPDALFSAIDVLESSVDQLVSLSHAQPKESPARALSDCVAGILRRHHDTLLLEAEQWVS